ncbi:MAG: FkbM family methyltransferase [Bacteroidetes bacterium]|nr:FkbM family methyltransferase [Bacteroidota bacterium]
MPNNLSVKFGNILYKHCFPLFRPLYFAYKRREDTFEIQVINSLLAKGQTVLDIGANIGFYTGIFSDIVGPGGKVHAFEPDVINYSHLSRTFDGKNNVFLRQKAVSEKTETLKIYTSKLLNVDHRTYPIEQYESSYDIEAVSIDDYVAGSFKIDFIKMDIQGNEVKSLRGMKKTLDDCKPVILTEFWPSGLKQAGDSANDFLSLVQSYGYLIYQLNNGAISDFHKEIIPELERKGDFGYINVLLSRDNKIEQLSWFSR